MMIPTTGRHNRNTNYRFFCGQLPSGAGFVLLGFVLFSFLWLGCKDTPTTYTVTFNTNGGTEVASQPVKQGAVVTKPANPTKAGFVFENWYSDATLMKRYDFASKVTANIMLHARWVSAYTVTFNTNGGTAIASQTVTEAGVVVQPTDPTKAGFIFVNWYSDEALTQLYDFSSKVTGVIVLYARWTPTTYTVIFDTGGGSPVASRAVKKDSVATKPADPVKKGFAFEGWYSDAGLTQLYDFSKKVKAGMKLYAKWVSAYTVTFDTGGGSPVASRAVKKDSVATKPANPTKKGYTFENWYSDKALTQVYDFATKMTGDITLYAKWIVKAGVTYTVTFDTGGGSPVASRAVKKDSMATKPANPTREGYTFENWYSDKALTQVYDFATKVTGDITLYAKWMAKAGVTTYTVTFDTKGGTAIPPLAVAANGVATRPVADPTRKDYVFGGWYSDEALTQVYDFKAKVTGNITLYAKWNPFPTSFTIAAAGEATQLPIGRTLQFRITNIMPAGADTTVIWSVEGGAANDSISANGLYTAPATIPNPAQITIKAVSSVATNVTRTYSLTIVDNPDLRIIPDARFRKALRTKIPNAFVGDKLDIKRKDVTELTTLDVINRSIDSLEGIQYFTSLRKLYSSANRLTSLDVSKNIYLEELTCENNKITSLDLSKNTELILLYCSSNQLTSLDLSKNTKLTTLYCASSQLTSLDLSQNTALITLYLGGNKLTTLDLPQNTVLYYLDCSLNKLTALDVSKNTALTKLYCGQNSLTSLDLSKNTKLAILSCYNNSLTSLDLSRNTKLSSLFCYDNSLTSLDMRGMRMVYSLAINAGGSTKNPLTTLKVHENIKQHSQIKTVKTNRGDTVTIALYTADAGSTTYTEKCPDYNPNVDRCALPPPTSFSISSAGNVTQLPIGTTLQFRITNVMPAGTDTTVTWRVEGGNGNGVIAANGLYTAPATIPDPAQITIKATSVSATDVTRNYSLTIVDNPNLKIIPDDNFRARLKALLPNAFVKDRLNVKHTDVTGFTTLNVKSLSIANLEGIQYFTALTTLECQQNQLTSLDVSKNTALTNLSCANNQLTSLDISKNTLLTTLGCSNNQLTSLDVSKNTALSWLSCNHNRLTGLDVSKHPNLARLFCSNNRLTVLDFSQNRLLDFLDCSANQLTGLDIRGMRGVVKLVINAGDSTKNRLTTLKVHENIKQHSQIKTVKTNRGSAVTIAVYTADAGSTTYTESCGDYDPNANVCAGKKSTSFTIATAGDVTQLLIGTTLQFRVTNVQPTDADRSVTWRVEGGSGNGSIDANGLYTAPRAVPTPVQITIKATGVLDNTVTQTYNLTITNLVTIPDANFRTKLKAIVPNAFVGDKLKVDHMEVTGLQELDVSNSSIASLEGIQYFTALTTLRCQNNNLTSLGLPKNTALTKLYCFRNNLASLDVSKDTLLTVLSCHTNRLASLELSSNTALDSLNCYSNTLTTLDVSKHLNLAYLLCSNNRLTVLDVSKNTALSNLICDNNNLTSLDLSQNRALTEFNCFNNSLTSLDVRGMRSASSATSLSIGAGAYDKNPLTILRVHDNLKQHRQIKAAKTNRGTNITIEVYTAAAGSTAYTQSCANYDPNANSGNGQCSSTN